MRWVEPIAPVRGISENDAYAKQAPLTARDGRNVRANEGSTGRVRHGQRSGTKPAQDKFNPVSDDNKVALVAQLKSSTSGLTYAHSDPPTVDWDAATPSQESAIAIASDSQGNTIATDGRAGLVKKNADGRQVWRLNLPAADDAHRVRALAIGATGLIFAAVSEGGSQETARAWCYAEDFDGKPELLWQLETGAYWEDIQETPDGTLYTLQNDVTNWRSFSRQYTAIGSTVPILSYERSVPYPANDLAVKADGSFAVAAEPFANRGQSPFSQGTTASSIDWTPYDLDDAQTRLWSHLDAAQIPIDFPELEDGDEVTAWRDRSGNGRSVFANPGIGTAPIIVARGLAGLPAVRFDGVDDEMFSSAATSVAESAADSQKTLLPMFTGSGFCAVMAIRAPASTTKRWVLGQSTPATRAYIVSTNRSASTSLPGPTVSGKVSLFAQGATGAAVGGAHPVAGDHSNDNEIAIISIVADNAGAAGAYFRVNGDPGDRFTTLATSGTTQTWLGVNKTNAGALDPSSGISRFDGDILEVIVLRDYDPGTGRTIVEAPDYPAVASTGGTTELERLEGYLAHKWGVSHQLDDGDPSIGIGAGAPGPWPHPHDLANGPPTSGNGLVGQLNHPGALVAKFGATQGAVKWICKDDSPNPKLVADDVGGVGYGVIADGDGNLFSVGPKKGTDDSVVRRIIDSGDSFSLDPVDGAWDTPYSSNDDQRYRYPRLAIDSFGNLYVPKDAATDEALVVYTRDGDGVGGATELYTLGLTSSQRGRAVTVPPDGTNYGDDAISRAARAILATENAGGIAPSGSLKVVSALSDGDTFTIDDGYGDVRTFEIDTLSNGVGGGNVQVFAAGASAPADFALAIATAISLAHGGGFNIDGDQIVPSNVVRLSHDLGGSQGNVPITVSLAVAGSLMPAGMTGGSDSGTNATIHSIDQVTATANPGSGRVTSNIAIANGNLKHWDESGSNDVPGGDGAFSNLAPFIDSAESNGELFLTDGVGRRYKVYTPPSAANPFGVVSDFEASAGGAPPARCQFLASWQKRLVFAGSPNDPTNIFMSRQGDPRDFNTAFTEPQAEQAWNGNVRNTAGKAPEIVRGLIPWGDDALLIPCDASLHILRGNPVITGAIDVLSEVTGMAPGRAWCRDDGNTVYLKSSKRGIMAVSGNGQVTPLSSGTIERQLSDIDLAKYNVELVWNYRDEGFHVFLFPRNAKHVIGDTLLAYFWDRKNGGWWIDEWSALDAQPTAAAVFDGDLPNDRRLILGRNDGRLVQWDEDAKNDAGSTIYSRVTYAPFMSPQPHREAVTSRLAARLSSKLDGCDFRMYATNNPEELGIARATGRMSRGQNPHLHAGARGAYCYLELFNGAQNESWSVEHMALRLRSGGRVRVR